MNLEEIAKLSGVSRSTVSRVINNDPRVRLKTRERVYEVIRQLDYQPNVMARSLAGGRAHVLGLVFSMGVSRLFTDVYTHLVIQGASMACTARDYSTMLWIVEPEFRHRTIQQVLYNKIIDGVIIASWLLDDLLLEKIINSHVPFILIGRYSTYTQVSYIDVDNQNSAREMVNYLLRLGCRRVATIAGRLQTSSGIERLDGYKAALLQWGLPYDSELVEEGDYTEEGGYRAMQRLISVRPDAVFAAGDAMAVGALRALREASLRVPDDVAVAGFDDMPFAERAEPPLTTVHQPTQKIGAIAAETLMDMTRNNDPTPRHIILPTELVIRASCGSAS